MTRTPVQPDPPGQKRSGPPTGGPHHPALTRTAARWRALADTRRPPEPPKGPDALWHAAEGRLRDAALARRRRFLKRAARILRLGPDLEHKHLDELRQDALQLRERFRRGRAEADDLDRALALAREIGARQLGLRAVREQIAAALALEAGCCAELATGEGKTLAAALAAVPAGWRGRGCHVITVNDYLAKRDAEWMAPFYQACGLTVRHVQQDMPPNQRRAAYAADLTYATNKEVTADFLRDRQNRGRTRSIAASVLDGIGDDGGTNAPAQPQPVMRGLEQAIVDEADSVLIDEAVTPLILSGEAPNDQQAETFREAAAIAAELSPDRDYRVDNRWREVTLTEAGRRRLDHRRDGLGGIWAGRRRSEELVVQALTARELFHPGRHYVLREGKVVIVDDFTGRLMPDRSWRNGLHQAIEAKEGLEIQPPKRTLARISFQRFFRLYRRLSGMTGTAAEARGELWQTYRLPVVRIPTHRPCIRKQQKPRLFATAERRWRAVLEEVQRVHAAGRPVLIGTRSVEASEHLSGLLEEAGLEHRVLNAVRHAEEAGIIAEAGQPGRITVATNMAGRGTDIQLGPGVREAGGLHVIATEAHESRRIDRQLFGRAARQGDPGSAALLASAEDELIKRHAPRWARTVLRLNPGPLARFLTRAAQNKAQRAAARRRRAVLKADQQLDEQLAFAAPEA